MSCLWFEVGADVVHWSTDASWTDRYQPQHESNYCVHPADLSVPPAWQGRSVAGPKLRLVHMAAFVEFTVPADMFTAIAVCIHSHSNYLFVMTSCNTVIKRCAKSDVHKQLRTVSFYRAQQLC